MSTRKTVGAVRPRFVPFKVEGPRVGVARAVGSFAIGSFAMGALSMAAVAVGSLAIGRVVVGRLRLGEGRIKHLRIDELEVGQFRLLQQEAPTAAPNGNEAAVAAEANAAR